MTVQSGTSTTAAGTRLDPAKRSAFAAVALQAIGLHAATHHLPIPHTIIVSELHQPLEVTLLLADRAAQEWWLGTVHVDDHTMTAIESGTRHFWYVRLPDTGVRVTLRGLRSHPAEVRR